MKKAEEMNEFGSTLAETEKVAAVKRSTNQKNQDSFFTTYFNRKEMCLEVYKELHKEDKAVMLDDVHIVTLKNVFINGIYNDVAFTVKDKIIILMEHQSKVNENMPIRMLLYLAEEYSKWLMMKQYDDNEIEDEEALTKTGYTKILINGTRVPLPEPEFYVIYTGDRKWNKTELWLSEAFASSSKHAIDLCVKIIHQPEIESNITFLEEFILCSKKFKALVKENKTREEAIQYVRCTVAVSQQMKEFLFKEEKGVIEMLKVELTQEDVSKQDREEGREEGILLTKRVFKLRTAGISPEEIAFKLDLDLDRVNEILA